MSEVLLSPDMTPEEFKAWYARLKRVDPSLNHTKLAERLDVDQPRIGKWLRGDVKLSGYLHLALERLEQIMIEERQPKRRSRRPPSPPPGTLDGRPSDE